MQRVVVLLSARAYVVRSFTATPAACPPYWQVGMTLHCDAAALELLRSRLERIPAVTAVLASPITDTLGPSDSAEPGRG